MSVIHILGASGSGVSTLGKALAEVYHYCYLDTDNFFWEHTDPPFTIKRDEKERVNLLLDEFNNYQNIVLSGSLCGWGDVLIPYFSLVINVETPQDIRLKRLKDREYNHFGSRILLGGDMFENHEAFIEWAIKFDAADLKQRSKVSHDKWLNNIECLKITVDGTKSTSELIQEIQTKYKDI